MMAANERRKLPEWAYEHPLYYDDGEVVDNLLLAQKDRSDSRWTKSQIQREIRKTLTEAGIPVLDTKEHIAYETDGNVYRYEESTCHGPVGADASLLRQRRKDMGASEYVSYIGGWTQGKMSGALGHYYYADGGEFVGSWNNNVQEGSGKANYPHGVTYEGEWKDGKQHGQGKMKFANGAVYEGQFKNGKRHGHGTFTTPRGQVYEGEFHAGERHGHGIVTTKKGYTYRGNWERGRIQGIGVMIFPDRKEYFKNDWPGYTFLDSIRLIQDEIENDQEELLEEKRYLTRVRDMLRVQDQLDKSMVLHQQHVQEQKEKELAEKRKARNTKDRSRLRK